MSAQFSSLNAVTPQRQVMSPATVARTDLLIDVVLMTLITTFAFNAAYHPYFWGDELIFPRLAIKHDHSIWPMFQEINRYKPRLVSNAIVGLLAKWQMERWVTAALQVACVVWINALLYGVVRYLLNGGRLLAWLVIATVLISRFGIVFYFDYSSGLLDLLGTALLLTTLLAAWLAWRDDFKWWYAAGALAAAVLCIFVHERFVAGLFAVGVCIAIAECVGASAKRRVAVVGWALSLGVAPLLLFWIANTAFGSMPMATGSSGAKVTLGWDTVWTALAYTYDVLLGGNYGPEFLWGTYTYSHPEGKFLGWVTVAVTAVMIVLIVWRKAIIWQNRWLAAGVALVAAAMIGVASLPGLEFLQPRWMFPVGILVAMIWIILLDGPWRHIAIAVMLATDLTYFLLGSHDSMVQVRLSRSASSLAGSLLGVLPNGRSGILVGSLEAWPIGGCCAVDMGPRLGDTFSTVSLKSALHIDPYVPGTAIDPTLYDFGVAYDGLTPNLTGRYRLVSVDAALVIAKASSQ